jgi:hypothetical protein
MEEEIKVKDLIALLSRFDGELKIKVNNGTSFISEINEYNRKLYISTSDDSIDAISLETNVFITSKK